MDINDLSLEKLLSLENKDGRAYLLIGHKYNDLKEYDTALEYYKKAETYENAEEDAVAMILDIYLKAFDKSIVLKDSENIVKKSFDYIGKFNKCYWKEEYLSKFDLYKGLFDFSKDRAGFKVNDNELNAARYSFLGCVAFYKEKDNLPLFDKMLKSGYCNAYLLAGRCYEQGYYFKQDEKKAKEYYKKAHDLKMIYATLQLGIICSHFKEHEESYKYIFDAATEYRGSSYNYTVTDSLIKELKNKQFGLSGAKLILARMLEFEFEDYPMCKNRTINNAKFFYESALKDGDKEAELPCLLFGLRHDDTISDRELKRLLSNNYKDVSCAAGYEKAIEFGLQKEAEVILDNILATNNFTLISELSKINTSDKVMDKLKTFKNKKEKFEFDHPYISLYKQEFEKQRLEEEQKKKEAKEKKEKELEEKRKLEKEKDENDYSKLIKLIQDREVTKALSMFDKGNGSLIRKFPVLYYIVKLLNKETCKRFEISYYNIMYSSKSTDKDKEYLNNLISLADQIEKCINENKGLDNKLKQNIAKARESYKYYDCFKELRTSIMLYINDNFNVEEKKKFLLRLALLDYMTYTFHQYSCLYEGNSKQLIYSIGEAFKCNDCRYNMWAIEYKKLGLFKGEEKKKIIEKMKRISAINYPAYLWLKNHKINVDGECYDKSRMEYFKRNQKEFIDLKL